MYSLFNMLYFLICDIMALWCFLSLVYLYFYLFVCVYFFCMFMALVV